MKKFRARVFAKTSTKTWMNLVLCTVWLTNRQHADPAWGSFQMEEWICESPRYNFSDLLTYLPFSTFFATFAIYYFGEGNRSFGGKKSPFGSCLTKFLIKLCRISNISNRFFCRACRGPCSRSRGVWDPWTTSNDSWFTSNRDGNTATYSKRSQSEETQGLR